MDFTLNEEQQLLKDSAEKFVLQDYDFDKRHDILGSPIGYDPTVWRQMAELGWLGMPFPEENGGFAGSPVETMILMEAIGKGLLVEPYLPGIVLSGGLVSRCGSPEQNAQLIPGLMAGELKLAFAYAEPQSRFNLADVETNAEKQGDKFLLSGHKSVVLHGASADHFIVSARTSGQSRDTNGVTLFIVDAAADGLTIREYPTIDGLRAAEVVLRNISVNQDAVLGNFDSAYPEIELAIDHGIAALCAEAVGAMDALCDATLEYLKTRNQFGTNIGSFQVLQHRMVDMYMELEQSRSMSYMASLKLENEDANKRRKSLSAAKVQIGRSGRFVGQQAVQLHGGMGMTDELMVSHYFKRLTVIDTQVGNVDYHLDKMTEEPKG